MMGIKSIKYCGLISFTCILLSQAGFATDSSTLTTPNVSPGNFALYDSGLVGTSSLSQYLQNTNSIVYQFSTNTACPTTYNPYVVVIPTMAYSTDMQVISSFGACLWGLNFPYGVTTYYDVSILTTVQNIVFDTSGIHGIVVNASNVNGFYWYLYCYPPGLPVPNNHITSGGMGVCNPSSDTAGTGTIPF